MRKSSHQPAFIHEKQHEEDSNPNNQQFAVHYVSQQYIVRNSTTKPQASVRPVVSQPDPKLCFYGSFQQQQAWIEKKIFKKNGLPTGGSEEDHTSEAYNYTVLMGKGVGARRRLTLKNAGEEAFIIQGNNDDCNNDYDQFELATVQNKGGSISRKPINCEVLPALIEVNHCGLNISI